MFARFFQNHNSEEKKATVKSYLIVSQYALLTTSIYHLAVGNLGCGIVLGMLSLYLEKLAVSYYGNHQEKELGNFIANHYSNVTKLTDANLFHTGVSKALEDFKQIKFNPKP